MGLNDNEGIRHIEGKQRLASFLTGLGHFVELEKEIQTPELLEEFNHDYVQPDLLVDGILCVYIDGEEHKRKGVRRKDMRKDKCLLSRGYSIARESKDDTLKQPLIELLENITAQVVRGPFYI